MINKTFHPFLFLAGLMLVVDLACSFSVNLNNMATISPSPVLPSNTPIIPTITPTLPTFTPTIPTFTPTVPTFTPTVPTFTPTVPTLTPTKGLLLHPVNPGLLHPIIPIVSLKLDYTASANYGEANLSAGFAPDPYSVGMTIGGDVDVSYLGGSCSGFATVSPDLRVNFGGGGSSLLRIYFVGVNGDSTMIVNDPYGNYYCVDDSFGTVNPTIDFNNPAGGTYDIWFGSYATNTTITGTLYLTEASGNHP